jgi:hypothetical protein
MTDPGAMFQLQQDTSFFEAGMLICFGASWPLSVYRVWKVKSSKGKSFGFLWLIFLGYLLGILHKILYHPDPVIWLYLLNATVVLLDITLSYHYRFFPGEPESDQVPGKTVE